MDRAELQTRLDREGYRRDAYSLSGGLREDTLCLDEAHGTWLVYYSERGKRWNERRFGSEAEACEYFLELIAADPDARA